MTPILSPAELAELLASNADVVLLDARASGYDAGHLRGAQRADLETQLSAARDEGADPAHGGRHPLPPLERWLAQLGAWGIGPETHVVIYDDQFGANAAARAWWMLRAVGHERVWVLDGTPANLECGGHSHRFCPMHTKAVAAATALQISPSSWQRPTVDLPRVDALRRDSDWK